VEESEAVAFEQALKKIDCNIDDRASIWTKQDIGLCRNHAIQSKLCKSYNINDLLKESKYVRLADTMFRILNKSRIPLFLHKSNHIFTVRQHTVLLVLRQYENKSYPMFIEWSLLFEAYYLRMSMQLSNIPYYTFRLLLG